MSRSRSNSELIKDILDAKDVRALKRYVADATYGANETVDGIDLLTWAISDGWLAGTEALIAENATVDATHIMEAIERFGRYPGTPRQLLRAVLDAGFDAWTPDDEIFFSVITEPFGPQDRLSQVVTLLLTYATPDPMLLKRVRSVLVTRALLADPDVRAAAAKYNPAARTTPFWAYLAENVRRPEYEDVIAEFLEAGIELPMNVPAAQQRALDDMWVVMINDLETSPRFDALFDLFMYLARDGRGPSAAAAKRLIEAGVSEDLVYTLATRSWQRRGPLVMLRARRQSP